MERVPAFSNQQSVPEGISVLVNKVERLQAAVQELRTSAEELEEERQRLLEENRKLRQKLTVSRLIEGLDASVGENGSIGENGHAVPSPAEQLYEELPARCSFTLFFRIARENGIDQATARGCLVYFLTEEYLEQSGSQLEKPASESSIPRDTEESRSPRSRRRDAPVQERTESERS